MLRNILTLTLIGLFISTTPDDDEIKDPLFGDLYKGKMYSGMLDTEDPSRRLHYIFIPSQNNPQSDPLVLWLNGGPGCSSLLGFIQEHGPVVYPDYIDTLMVNKFSWNKFANIIYLESPAGVGFSVNDIKDDSYDDDKTAKDNRKALLNWLDRFSGYKTNDFFIAGESYAGVYVPKLASLLLNDTGVNLKGIIVGNGITHNEIQNQALPDFAFEHGLYSSDIRSDFEKFCPIEGPVSHECNEVRKKIKVSLDGLNIYNILGDCPKGDVDVNSYQYAIYNTFRRMSKQIGAIEFLTQKFLLNDEDPVDIWPDSCKSDPNPSNFLNMKENKIKMHVDPNITYMECNPDIGEKYKLSESFEIYKNILLPSKKLRIWFYSGDTDGAVAFRGSIKWIMELGLKITEPYRAWVVNGQTAGFVQEYEGFTYLTVKGTGHMVPQWKREEAFILFNNFLKGGELPSS
jgi:carboxypeptidase C (cathepsin A)